MNPYLGKIPRGELLGKRSLRIGLAIKIILSIIAFNILQMMKRFDGN